MKQINASDLNRLIACPGSRTMAGLPAMETVMSTSKREGEAAHWLAKENFAQIEHNIGDAALNGHIITDDMYEHVDEFCDLAVSQSGGDFYYDLEQSLIVGDFNITGRAETILNAPDGLYLTDLRYGWQIVEPDKNFTMMFHAYVFCMSHHIAPEAIHIRIFQPRPYHRDGYLRDWVISWLDLCRHIDELRWNFTNNVTQLNTSIECSHCPALATCPAARMASYNAIEVSTAAFDDKLPAEVVSFELDQLIRAKKVIETRLEALQELAQFRLKSGEVIENYSLEPSMGNRVWNDGLTVDMLTILTGKPMAATPKPISPSAAIKANIPEAIVHSLSHRPPGGMKLVRESANKKAQRLFKPKG